MTIKRGSEDYVPENRNRAQDDESAQAQTVAESARHRRPSGDTRKSVARDETDDVEDLVDHMIQMDHSGRIDMSAYRGERSDDGEAVEADSASAEPD